MHDKMYNYIDWFFANRIGAGVEGPTLVRHIIICIVTASTKHSRVKYEIRNRASKLCGERRIFSTMHEGDKKRFNLIESSWISRALCMQSQCVVKYLYIVYGVSSVWSNLTARTHQSEREFHNCRMMQPHRRAEAEVACSCPTCDIRPIYLVSEFSLMIAFPNRHKLQCLQLRWPIKRQSLIYHAYGDTSYVCRRLW